MNEFQYRESFHKRHISKGGLPVLFGMVQNGATLQRMGDYYGLTRERVRQILCRITIPEIPKINYNSLFDSINKKPALMLKVRDYKNLNMIKGRKAEALFQNYMPDYNYNGHRAHCDFSGNKWNIEVKCCMTPRKPNKNKSGYYYFAISKKEIEHSDFVFVTTPIYIYLIPISKIKSNYIYIRGNFDRYIIDKHERLQWDTIKKPSRDGVV